MNSVIHFINRRVVTLNGIDTFTDVDLYATQSMYNTSSYVPTGSEYRLLIQSGSQLLASLPYDSTNIKVDYSTQVTQNNIVFIYNTFVSGTNPSSSYYFKIEYDSLQILNTGLDILPNSSNIFLNTASQYKITTYSGNSNYANLEIYDDTMHVIYSGSQSFSSSFTLDTTGSRYYVITSSISLYTEPL